MPGIGKKSPIKMGHKKSPAMMKKGSAMMKKGKEMVKKGSAMLRQWVAI